MKNWLFRLIVALIGALFFFARPVFFLVFVKFVLLYFFVNHFFLNRNMIIKMNITVGNEDEKIHQKKKETLHFFIYFSIRKIIILYVNKKKDQ